LEPAAACSEAKPSGTQQVTHEAVIAASV